VSEQQVQYLAPLDREQVFLYQADQYTAVQALGIHVGKRRAPPQRKCPNQCVARCDEVTVGGRRTRLLHLFAETKQIEIVGGHVELVTCRTRLDRLGYVAGETA